MRLMALGIFLVMTSCAEDQDGTDVSCGADQVEVAYLGTSNDRTECAPIPTECGAVAQCAELDCIRALYDLCDDTTYGVGCSDTFPPAIVSCNE